MPDRLRRLRRAHRRCGRGQSLVEFAIVLPVLLLLVLVALDFGRMFMGWVVLNNAARVGANYAASHASAWGAPGSATQQANYETQIRDAFSQANCALPGTPPGMVPAPTFPTGRDLGDTAVVSLSCIFRPLTPIIGGIVGNSLNVTASSIFPIRTGVISGQPVQPSPGCPSLAAFTWSTDAVNSLKLHFTDVSTGAPTSWNWDFGDSSGSAVPDPAHTYAAEGTYTVSLDTDNCSSTSQSVSVAAPPPSPSPGVSPSPSPAISPSPSPGCTVPSFIGRQKSEASQIWRDAGFSQQNITFVPDRGNWIIQGQSLVGGRLVPCNAPITLYELAPSPSP